MMGPESDCLKMSDYSKILLPLGMLLRYIGHFLDSMFVPLKEQDYSGLENLILYLSLLFCLFLWVLYT